MGEMFSCPFCGTKFAIAEDTTACPVCGSLLKDIRKYNDNHGLSDDAIEAERRRQQQQAEEEGRKRQEQLEMEARRQQELLEQEIQHARSEEAGATDAQAQDTPVVAVVPEEVQRIREPHDVAKPQSDKQRSAARDEIEARKAALLSSAQEEKATVLQNFLSTLGMNNVVYYLTDTVEEEIQPVFEGLRSAPLSSRAFTKETATLKDKWIAALGALILLPSWATRDNREKPFVWPPLMHIGRAYYWHEKGNELLLGHGIFYLLFAAALLVGWIVSTIKSPHPIAIIFITALICVAAYAFQQENAKFRNLLIHSTGLYLDPCPWLPMLGLAAITIYNLIKPIDVGAVEAFAWMDSLAIGFITPKFLAIILAAIKPTAVWREQSSKPSATQAKTAAQPSQE